MGKIRPREKFLKVYENNNNQKIIISFPFDMNFNISNVLKIFFYLFSFNH